VASGERLRRGKPESQHLLATRGSRRAYAAPERAARARARALAITASASPQCVRQDVQEKTLSPATVRGDLSGTRNRARATHLRPRSSTNTFGSGAASIALPPRVLDALRRSRSCSRRASRPDIMALVCGARPSRAGVASAETRQGLRAPHTAQEGPRVASRCAPLAGTVDAPS
jgi:hypothetical protein